MPHSRYSGKIGEMRFSAAGRLVLVMGLLVAGSASCAHPARVAKRPTTSTESTGPAAATATVTPVAAQPVAPDPRVGAVFLGSTSLHTCTGAVLHSARGDLILTAAHCLTQGVDTTFVAGLDNDAAPDAVWHVDAVYLDPRWVQKQDPRTDYAIARVSRDSGGTVEAAAGGGLTLAPAPNAGTTVTVIGYATGVGGRPIGCSAATVPATKGYPTLPCAALVDGVSGAPWVTGSAVAGLIGGLNGGGCDERSPSYSPPFDDATAGLLTRAEAGGPPDQAPSADAADECD